MRCILEPKTLNAHYQLKILSLLPHSCFLIPASFLSFLRMTTLITNINSLVNIREEDHLLRGKELSHLPVLKNAYLIVEDERISAYGSMKDFAFRKEDFSENVDASGKMILPSWCDSHTHLVFAGSRENEFVEKIRGASYAEIAAKGGGIINSAKLLNETSE